MVTESKHRHIYIQITEFIENDFSSLRPQICNRLLVYVGYWLTQSIDYWICVCISIIGSVYKKWISFYWIHLMLKKGCTWKSSESSKNVEKNYLMSQTLSITTGSKHDYWMYIILITWLLNTSICWMLNPNAWSICNSYWPSWNPKSILV